MKKETTDFVEENLEMLETLAEHGNLTAKKMALAFLIPYYTNKKKKKRIRKRKYT